MNYEKLVQGILNIGEAMLQCGAEIFRVEDSLYRMYKSYGFVKYDVYVIPSNIQVTVESPEGEILTQIRHIESTGADYDRLNYLNALSRYVCAYNPDDKELVRRYKKVMARPDQSELITGIAQITGGTAFTVFFGGDIQDAVVALIVCLMIVLAGRWLGKREGNPMIYNLILAFLSEVVIISAARIGLGDHPDRIMIGIIMLLVSALGVINGIRDVMQRNFISGALEVMNSMLGAFGIASGIALAMLLMGNISAEGFDVNKNTVIQLISCTIGCIGYASWFKIRGKKILYSGVGAFLTWGIYLLVYAWYPNNFSAIVAASCFVENRSCAVHGLPDRIGLSVDAGSKAVLSDVWCSQQKFFNGSRTCTGIARNVSWYCIWIYYCRCDFKKYHAGAGKRISHGEKVYSY